MMTSRNRFKLVLVVCCALYAAEIFAAEEPTPVPTPSEKMKEAVDKFNKAPATIGQSLQGLRDAAADKLKQTLGGSAKSDHKAAVEDLKVPQKTSEVPAAPHTLKEGSRDPFRPMTLRSKVSARARENLSPLERFDLGQLKVVGIVSNIKEPQAMVEDTSGLGYIVKKGTPIGNNDGIVKAIQRDQIIVEESYADAYGAQRKHEVYMKLSTE